MDLTEPIVRFWFERGLSPEVHRRLHDAAEVPDAPDDERVRGLITAAGLALATCQPASLHRSASQAVAAAHADDVGGALALALGQRAYSGVLSGLSTSEQVEADVEQALQLAERCEDASTHVYVLTLAGAALIHGRSIDAGYRLFQRGLDVCEANDLTFHLPAAHANSVMWLAWSGRLDRTRRHARRAVELSRRLGRPGWEAVGLTWLAAAAVLQGDLIRAQEWLSEAQVALRPRALETHYGMWLRHWLCLWAYASGDMEAARATAEEIVRIGRGGGSRLDEAIGEWLLGMVARSQERHDDARAHLESSRALSTDPRLPQTLGWALLGLAELAREDGDFDEAWELAHDSLGVLDDYGDRVGAAAALEQVADLAVARGEPERALRLLAASQRFHEETGIARFPFQADRFDRARNTAHAALDPADGTACWDAGSQLTLADAIAYARRGRGERGRPQIGWASLTPTEREIVQLVAQGHTNAEIGERLFISVHTVKKHLSHVYAKVGLDSRAELVAQAAHRDL